MSSHPAFRSCAAISLMAIALLVSNAFAIGNCGTFQRIENIKRLAGMKPMRATPLYRTSACNMDDYYDSVYTRETRHFQIFYTLGNGPHATTEEFIDSLAVTLENAFTFHTSTMSMRTPLGLDTTSHYQKSVKEGLYPVEVADLNFLRDPFSVLHEQFCDACYAVTYPSSKDYHKSSIIIDNDFKYVPLNYRTDSLDVGGVMCPYPIASETLTNKAYGYSYDEEWAKAIRVTVFHELFHAVQLQYIDVTTSVNSAFWTEASATANEEIGAPDIDDYFFYVPKFINSTGISLYQMTNAYSISVFYLYLYNHVDKHFDREIWERFSQQQGASFTDHLKAILDKRDLGLDSIYQDFVKKLALSGPSASTFDKKLWISDDQIRWDSPRPMTMEEYGRFRQNLDIAQDQFIPDTTSYAFNFYLGGNPVTTDYKGRASAIIFKDGKASFKDVVNTKSLDTINTQAFLADSIMWVFSRFENPKWIPDVIADSTIRAYPTPWRGTEQLCFTPLPENGKFVEIRNARGDLVLREPYERTTHCIEGDYIKSKMKPGVYRFRAGSSGKMKKFLVVY